CHYNAWFTPENVEHAVKAIGQMLNKDDLQSWLSKYDIKPHAPKRIGLVLAGNIPLVGFHDVLCVLVSGNIAHIKASLQDSRLIMQVLKRLVAIEPAFAERFKFSERLENFDAVIATGSNNTSRYFEYYFGKVPHIIRKNRNSVAVLTGEETNGQLRALGHDIFDYFGLGCRNISKLFVPQGYNFGSFFEPIESYKNIIHHHKYNNNYDYNKSIYLVNRDKHLDNGFLLLKEDTSLTSPLAVLFFEYYDSIDAVQETLRQQSENIQCIVCIDHLQVNNQVVAPGQSQQPALWDYADGVDTMDFLTKL
ncbi:MAG TPA: acyl-CoA reductase, partial [Mucilaginibacter sp.]|nr:acyl-CoA reductase [Mucilaginibacter sp.]